MSIELFEQYYHLILSLIENEDINLGNILNILDTYKLPSGVENKVESIKILFDSHTMNFDDFSQKYITHNKIEIVQIVTALIYFNNTNTAKSIINRYIELNIHKKDSVIIKRMYKLIEDITKVNNDIDTIAKDDKVKIIQLKEKLSLKSRDIKEFKKTWDKENIFAYRPKKIEKLYPFENNLKDHPERALLEKSGFSRHIWKDAVDKLYVLHGAQIGGYDWKTRTLFDDTNGFYPILSGKLALLMNKNISQIPTRNGKCAYCLPFPHNSNNYYHVMSEAIYGLRYIKDISSDTIIIYENDKYNLLKYFSSKMNIDFDRFIKATDIMDVRYKFIFSPDKPPYYWDKKCFNFFSQFVTPNNNSKKIYISRINCHDARTLVNESDLEKELEANGVDIIHAEELSIQEQIEAFSSASTVIGPHGAGFTNILFCKPEFKFIELFSDKYVVPDFYLRSQHINARYTPHICKNNKIDIDTVIKNILQ